MLCPFCGYENRPGQRSCANCGKPLQAAARREGERKLVTMLFADVVGSTAAAEQLDPEDWGEIIAGVDKGVSQAIERYGGTVVQLLGDGLLAFFGAPVAHEDDAERAVRAALDIRAFMADYGADLEGLSERLQIRVGLHSGLVVVGNMGSGQRVEYLAVGDSVNTAARIQGAAEPDSVVVSDDTYRQVKHLFDVKPLGATEVKGKSEPILLYAVLGAKAVPGQARGVEGLDAPLIGRDAELRHLQERVTAVRGGQGSFVAVFGEAGIGKSRLVAELRKSTAGLPGPEIDWLEGRSLSYSQSVSYFPWRQIIRAASAAGEDDPPATVREKLRGGGRLAPEEIPFLEAMLAVESPESLSGLAAYEGSALVEQITAAARSYFRNVARGKPTVLLLDDLHWADDASLDLLASLAGLPAEAPLLIICLQRPDPEAPSGRTLDEIRARPGGSWYELRLEPLPPDTSQELLGQLLPVLELPDAVRDLILARSEGNPFFLEEVLRGLIDDGYLEREDSHWRARREIAEVTIPETLAGVLAARIDRLPENTKRVAQMASVVGRSFAYRVLKAIYDEVPAGERLPDLDRHLQTLTREEILCEQPRQPEPEYMFKHALTQEAAYNSLLIKRRRAYHRQAGLVLEELYADRLDEHAAAIAFHFWHAEEWARAADHALRAGAASMKVSARHEALLHYEQALDAFGKLPQAPYERVVDATLTWMGIAATLRPYEGQLARLARAEELARGHADKRRLALTLNWIGNAHIANGLFTRALGPLNESYGLASELHDETITVLPSWAMAWSMINTDPRAAIARLRDVVAMADRQHNLEVEAQALAAKAMAHARLGQVAEAERDAAAALRVVQGTRSVLMEADVNLLAGYTYLDLGDIQRGLDYSRRSLEGAISSNAPQCAASALYCQGMGRLQTKAMPEAIQDFAESVKLAERTVEEHLPAQGTQGYDMAAEQMVNRARMGLAVARYRAAETDALKAAALQDIRSSLATARAQGDAYTSALVAETLGEIVLGSGDHAAAGDYLASALEYYRRNGMSPYVERAERLLSLARRDAAPTQPG